MIAKTLRTKKSEWLLSSFYFMTFFIVISYSFIFLRVAYHGLKNTFVKHFLNDLWSVLLYSGGVSSKAMLLSAISAIFLTVFLVLCEGHIVGRLMEKFFSYLVKIPLIMSGLSIIFWFKSISIEFLTILVLYSIIFPRLSLQWFALARTLRSSTIEAALSLGMGFWQVLYHIYVRKYFLDFIKIFLATFISVVGLVTPFLYFISNFDISKELLSVLIFRDLLGTSDLTSLAPVLVLVLLILSVFNVLLSPSGDQYGEWNG